MFPIFKVTKGKSFNPLIIKTMAFEKKSALEKRNAVAPLNIGNKETANAPKMSAKVTIKLRNRFVNMLKTDTLENTFIIAGIVNSAAKKLLTARETIGNINL